MKRTIKIILNAALVLAVVVLTILSVNFSAQKVSLEKSLQKTQYNSKNYETQLDKLKSQVDTDKDYIEKLEIKNDTYAKSAQKYKVKVTEYEREKANEKAETAKASKTSSSHFGNTLSADTGFRSWMPFTALATGTPQYNVSSQARPNGYGILEYEGRAVVAVGFGWGLTIGDTATVTTTNGSFKIVVGDWKANCDTDATHKVTTANGCVVEFIVDRSCLASCIKTSGSVASVNKYAGKVLNITYDGTNVLK